MSVAAKVSLPIVAPALIHALRSMLIGLTSSIFRSEGRTG